MSLLHSYSNVKVKPSTNRLALRTVSVALMLVMLMGMFTAVMAGVASAAWPQFQGNLAHNGQITASTPPTNSTVANVTLGGLIDSPPVMNTENGVTYAYVFSIGGTVSKINCDYRIANPSTALAAGQASGEWVKLFPANVAVSGPYQLSTPCLIETGPYAGVYVALTDYYPLLTNPQFVGPSAWTNTSANHSGNQWAIQAGGSISQTFTYDGTTSAVLTTELFSQVKLQAGSANPGKVTYTITTNKTPSLTYTVNPASTTDWTSFDTTFSKVSMTHGQSYTITVTANVGNVIVDHVDYSCQTVGINKISFDGTTVTPIAATAGQAITPIVTDGQYLFFGTSGTENYFQIELSSNNVKSCSSGYPVYWGGATIVTINDANFIVYGTDGGHLILTPVGSNFGTISKDINLASYYTSPGDVRSSISQDGEYIYFSSKGTLALGHGYVWRADVATLLSLSPSFKALPLSGASTSTPAIAASGWIYVGYNGGFTTGGVVAIDPTFTSTIPVVSGGFPVQASPLVYTDDDVDYIYFTTNAATGTGYCYKFDTSSEVAMGQWLKNSAGSNQVLQGFAYANGYLAYGDDSKTLYIMK